MRHLLISVAALALTAGAAFAQPDHEHGRGHRAEQGGAPAAAPQVQRPAPAPIQAAPQRAEPMRGGPQSFTAQIQGHQPDQGQGRFGGERGNWQERRAAQVAPQQQAVAPQPQDNRGNWQGRGERGNWQGRGAAQVAPQQQAAAPQDNRGSWQGRGERGNRQGRDDWRTRQQAMAPQEQNGGWQGRDRGSWQGGYAGRGNWQDYSNGGYRGQRFASRSGARDYSTFRDFHRDFRAQHRFHVGGYHRPSGWYAHNWTFGEFLPAPFWVRDYWLMDYADYDLPPPPYGTVWVRVNDDALLIDADSGEIITVAYGVFY